MFDKNCSDLFLEAEELNREHPGCGIEKMYFTLKPAFIGRDKCIEMLMESGFQLKHKKIIAELLILHQIIIRFDTGVECFCSTNHLAIGHYFYRSG